MQLSSSLLFFFFVYSPPASVVHAALWGAVVSERFFSVLNLSISLCPGKKIYPHETQEADRGQVV